MARRYGKVTVTGWIEQNTAETYVAVARAGLSPLVARIYEDHAALNEQTSAVVEFLPEPVVWRDGDALRFSDQEVWVRVRGRWVSSETGGGGWEDYVAANYLQRGDCVRLVAEGATDAG